MQYLPFVWLVVAVLAAIVEALVPALVSIWFVAGGVAALIASLVGAPLWVQAVLFFAVSALALAVTRPLAHRVQKTHAVPTNADRVIGAEALVTETITTVPGGGRVTVQGVSWAARAENHEEIPAGEIVVVERIEGVKLIVRRT